MFHQQKVLARKLAEAEARVRELESWQAQTREWMDRAGVQQLELAGEITTTLRGSAGISRDSTVVQGRMGAFEENFQGAFRDLGRIDGQIVELDRNIATAGAAVDQTSAAIEEVTASIARISQESTARFQDIQGVAQLTRKGQEEMESTAEVIRSITAQIEDLRSFLEIIDDIADKTSILSMNAAIQAAHAGDVGKGFAVVADEIRRLAESSAANASAIAQQLEGLVAGIRQAAASSGTTAQILGETERKAAQAAVGFQEIEQGARDLALGGQEILEGIGSLRQASTVMRNSSAVIRENSQALTDKLGHLRGESTALEGGLRSIRQRSADLNGSGLVLTTGTIQQLQAQRQLRTGGTSFDQSFGTILILQHLSWVARVRGVLDGALTLEAQDVSDHHQCDFGKWLDREGKASIRDRARYQRVFEAHEKLHTLARTIVGLKAEERFPELTALSETLVRDIRALADEAGDGLVAWTPALEIGQPKVDQQHRKLVDLVNQLSSALRSGQARHEQERILAELVDYTVTHFEEEEALFRPTKYPETAAHLAQHREFIESVTRFQSDFQAGKVVLGSDTLSFLKDWLVNHIQGTDRGIVQYL